MATDVHIPDHYLEDFSDEEAQALRDHINMDAPVDLTANAEGMDLIRRLKARADSLHPKPPRIPDMGELPPSHLRGEELERWVERQRRQAFLPGDPQWED